MKRTSKPGHVGSDETNNKLLTKTRPAIFCTQQSHLLVKLPYNDYRQLSH
jgi:hypothetical protein